MYRPSSTDIIPPEAHHVAPGLTDKQLASARRRTLSRGETICEPGLPEIVGYVVSGAVKLVTFSADGRTNIIAVIEAPGFFGRLFGISAEFTIEAASDVVLACFDRNAFEQEIAKSPQLEHVIHMENLHQLDEAHERITVLACQTMVERIATYLVLRLLSAEARSPAGSPPLAIIHVPVNRRDFAAYLGTTVETVSRTIQALVRRGTIAVIDSANFRLLRRRDLFAIARQDEDDLVEMVRSRAKPAHFRRPLLSPAAEPLTSRDRRSDDVSLIAAE